MPVTITAANLAHLRVTRLELTRLRALPPLLPRGVVAPWVVVPVAAVLGAVCAVVF